MPFNLLVDALEGYCLEESCSLRDGGMSSAQFRVGLYSLPMSPIKALGSYYHGIFKSGMGRGLRDQFEDGQSFEIKQATPCFSRDDD